MCKLESALAKGNTIAATQIIAEAKGRIGDDGKTKYTFECNKCKKLIPCVMVLPFSVIDISVCVGGGKIGEFKLVEQHKEVVNEVKKVVEDVKKVKVSEVKKEDVKSEGLPL